jgi:hypothetical protein
MAPNDDTHLVAAQAVEHYEMTRYGTLIAWAKELGRSDCASVLQQNLDEEKAADQKLTSLTESNVNRKAADRHPAAGRPSRPRPSDPFWNEGESTDVEMSLRTSASRG